MCFGVGTGGCLGFESVVSGGESGSFLKEFLCNDFVGLISSLLQTLNQPEGCCF